MPPTHQVGGVVPGQGARLQGCTALVTGAGGSAAILGGGEAIARLFAAQGATVGVLDVDADRVKHTAARIGAEGGTAVPLVADIADEASVREAVSQLVKETERLDIVVNNAAVTGGAQSVIDIQLDAWENTVRVNLSGTMLVSRTAYPHLVASDAPSIVNVSSVAANRGGGVGAYAASKGAIQSLTVDLAFSWGQQGIRVNCVAPGYIHATMSGQMSEEARQIRKDGTLLCAEGGAWEIAWAALFLASPESRWITGVVLPVDGGASATTAVAVGRRTAK
jgi:NAD(P)-dependent dehydrogenase (short-subunit alcohol dehydrogenase family)